MHPPPDPEVGVRAGDVIADKYRVDRVLGIGGMGVVVAAHHLQLQELVAIKVLLPEAHADADAVRRFEREARAAFKIKSEHVARIIDVGTLDSGAPFIVMEYLEGEDLADRVERNGPLAADEAIELLLQACEAIAEAHALGIIHRDLKPANLFCVRGADGRPAVKVLDFGISKLTSAEKHGAGLGMTKTRELMGSPYYMSPEQMQSPRTVDARTDIWSLGVVLYQVLTGEVPFNGETLPQVCVNVATRPAPPLRKIRSDIPPGLEMIVLRCLEKDVSKRYATVSQLATALSRFGSRRAQASLERIVRLSPYAEEHDDEEPAARRHGTDRPVTGPLPTWGGTAKSQDGRPRGMMGRAGGAFLVGAVGFTLALTFAVLRSWNGTSATPEVLIAPPGEPQQKEPSLERPHAGPLPPAAELQIAPGVATVVLADSALIESPAAAGSAPIFPVASGAPISPAGAVPTSLAANAAPISPPVERSSVGPTPAKLPTVGAPGMDLSRSPLPPPATAADLETDPYAPVPASPKPTTAESRCLLNLNAMPPAKVLLDGRPLGFTPRIGVPATPGEHRVLFRWDDADKHASVTCAKGETKTVAVRLYESPTEDERLERNPYR